MRVEDVLRYVLTGLGRGWHERNTGDTTAPPICVTREKQQHQNY